jgi:hypothetical protein
VHYLGLLHSIYWSLIILLDLTLLVCLEFIVVAVLQLRGLR